MNIHNMMMTTVEERFRGPHTRRAASVGRKGGTKSGRAGRRAGRLNLSNLDRVQREGTWRGRCGGNGI